MNAPLRTLAPDETAPCLPRRVTLVALLDSGLLLVQSGSKRWNCEWLHTGGEAPVLAPGDRLLALPPDGDQPGVVLGRLARYEAPQPAGEVRLEAAQSLTLTCGESSLTLKADGKVLLKGDDVVVRAKGTQRIRAGHVAIN